MEKITLKDKILDSILSIAGNLSGFAIGFLLVSIVFMLDAYFLEEDPLYFYRAFIIFLVMLCSSISLYFVSRTIIRYKMKEMYRKIKVSHFSIGSNIDEIKFLLRTNFWKPSDKNPYSFKDDIIYWANIKDILLEENQKSIKITLDNNTEIVLSEDCGGWYEFIAKIPKDKFQNFNYAAIDEIYAQFKSCKICGAVAVIYDKCENCGNDVWSEEFKEGCEDEIKFIKEEQLEFFSTCDSEEKINTIPTHFSLDPNWSLLVSEAEILAYSKEHWWDEEV